MDSLEEYIALIAKENHVSLDRKDQICILHTILAKFERDLLESQRKILDDFSGKIETLCLELDLAEKARSEKALSFARSSAEQLMKSIPTTMKATVEEASFKKTAGTNRSGHPEGSDVRCRPYPAQSLDRRKRSCSPEPFKPLSVFD